MFLKTLVFNKMEKITKIFCFPQTIPPYMCSFLFNYRKIFQKILKHLSFLCGVFRTVHQVTCQSKAFQEL